MSLSNCMVVVNGIAPEDRDSLLSRVDGLISSGIAPDEAGRMAARDMLAEIEREIEDFDKLAREQHPEAFAKPEEPEKEPEPNIFSPPQYSRRQGRFTLREFGAVAKTLETQQDRYNRWKQAIEDVKAQGGQISDDNNFYLAEERYWSRVSAQIDDFQEEVRDWVKEVVEDGLDLQTVALYAYAEHAKDRNRYIASIRPTMPDGGSGMTNDEADSILQLAQLSGLDAKIRPHTAKLREWIQGTRDIMLAEGLITPEQYAEWTHNMASYVPLRGLPDDTTIPSKPFKTGTGKGFDVRGEESKRMLGRKSQAKQIIEQIIADRTKAVIRGGKNDVGRHFLKFVLDNPSPNLWEVSAVENKPVLRTDPVSGDPIIEEDTSEIKDDRTITVKDGGREIHILVVDEKLREQLKNLNQSDGVNPLIGALLTVSRLQSRLYTSLNPVFALITNPIRDIQTATVGLIDELGFLSVPKFFARLPGAIRDAANAELRSQRSSDYELFRVTAKTGFWDFKTVDDLSKQMSSDVKDAERGAINPIKLGPRVVKLLESISSVLENAIRFAAFQEARAEGKSLVQAGTITKNLTVNFNRKGTMTPTMSAMFLFWNPAIQGTTRMIQALANPKVQATVGAAMTGTFFLALQNASMGDDDDGESWWDKIPNETKERNMVIVLPPGVEGGEAVPGSKVGRYIKIPMPYGYNFFASIANNLADVYRNTKDPRRGVTWDRALARSFGAFMGSWVPAAEVAGSIENSKTLPLIFTPDVVNPVVQNVLNVNAFGRALSPDDAKSRNLPSSEKYFAGQAGTLFQRAAEGINSATGGDAFTPGLVDLSPGQIENLVRGYGGGVATFALDIVNTIYARQFLDRPEVDIRRAPGVKQLYGRVDDETDRMLAYQRMQEVQKVVDRLEAATASDTEEGEKAAQRIEKEYGPIADMGGDLLNVRESLSGIRKEELEIVADKEMSEGEKLAKLTELNKERRLALQDFNRAYGEALVERLKEQAKAASK